MKYRGIGFGLLLVGTSVTAQEPKLVTAPAIGTETITATGGELFTYGRMSTVEGAKLDAPAKAGDWLMQRPYPAGTVLVPTSSSAKFKGCVPKPGTLQADGPCFLDDDGDGRFDRQSKDIVTMALKLKEPAPYTRQPVSVIQPDSLRYVILYQGATADTLRFSYREFRDDLARPAFTEELLIPREPFPQMAMLKSIQLEVLSVTGMGLRYRIIKVGGLGS